MNWEEYSRILLKKCQKKGVPYHACFELTPLCNFSCNMCYIRLTPEQAKLQGEFLTTEQWINLATEAKRSGVISLEVTGGEAATRSDFSVLYKYFINLGFVVNLRTNGYLINGKILNLLKQYKPHRIGITIYGASDETYRKVCGISDGFSVVSENILTLKNEGFNLHLSMMITKDNIDDRKPLFEWASANNLQITPHGGLINPIRGADRNVDHLRIIYTDDECEIKDNYGIPTSVVSNNEDYLNPFWMCKAFGSTFCISWDGRMTLCNTMTAVWKDPLSGGLELAYKELYDGLRTLRRPPECNKCSFIEYCSACPSQLLSATNNPELTNESICRNARRRYKQLHEL